MTPELLEAIETVRRYDAGDGAVGSHEHERVSAAFRLLAREFVRLLDAGELVRKVSADDCLAAANELIEHGYCSTNGLMTLDLLRYRVAVVIAANTRLAAALEPIIPTEAHHADE